MYLKNGSRVGVLKLLQNTKKGKVLLHFNLISELLFNTPAYMCSLNTEIMLSAQEDNQSLEKWPQD